MNVGDVVEVIDCSEPEFLLQGKVVHINETLNYPIEVEFGKDFIVCFNWDQLSVI